MAVRIKFNADAQAVLDANEAVADSAEDMGDEYEKAADDAKAFARAAADVKKAQTPLQKFEGKVKDLRKALQAGRISQEQFDQTTLDLGRRFNLTEDDLEDLNDEINRNASSTRGARGAMTGWGAEIGGLTSFVNEAIQAINALNEEYDRAQQTFQQVDVGYTSLANVATSPAELRRLQQQARDILSAGAAANIDEAANLSAQIQNIGARGADVDLITQFGGTGQFTDLSETLRVVDSVRKSFGEQAGSLEDVFSQAFAANRFTTESTENLLQATAEIGKAAAAIGATDEEATALITALAQDTGDAAKARTQANALLGQIDKKGLTRGDLQETIQGIQTRVAAGEDIRAIIGDNQEAVAGFRTAVDKLDVLTEIEDAVTQAQRPDARGLSAADRAIETALSDPLTRARLDTRRALGREQVSELARGAIEQLEDNLITQQEQLDRANNISQVERVFNRRLGQFYEWATGDPLADTETARLQLNEARESGNQAAMDIAQEQLNTLREIKDLQRQNQANVPRPEN